MKKSFFTLDIHSYIPEQHMADGDLDQQIKQEVNSLNNELVQKLKAQDTAFSSGSFSIIQLYTKFS